MPFDWRTPLGYSIALVSESLASYSMVFMGGPSACFFVGSCSLIMGFVKNITNDLSSLSVSAISKKNQKKKLKLRFYNILQDFSDAKQLCKISNNSIY